MYLAETQTLEWGVLVRNKRCTVLILQILFAKLILLIRRDFAYTDDRRTLTTTGATNGDRGLLVMMALPTMMQCANGDGRTRQEAANDDRRCKQYQGRENDDRGTTGDTNDDTRTPDRLSAREGR